MSLLNGPKEDHYLKYRQNLCRCPKVAEHRNWRKLDGKMARDMSDKDILKMEIEQLQKEAKNTREPVSKTAKEICEFAEAQSAEDPLIKGVPEDKNPFKEKGGCIIT
ncbi:hypothetical protein SRHO_G00198330 [Serrasalmus rhombeus]